MVKIFTTLAGLESDNLATGKTIHFIKITRIRMYTTHDFQRKSIKNLKQIFILGLRLLLSVAYANAFATASINSAHAGGYAWWERRNSIWGSHGTEWKRISVWCMLESSMELPETSSQKGDCVGVVDVEKWLVPRKTGELEEFAGKSPKKMVRWSVKSCRKPDFWKLSFCYRITVLTDSNISRSVSGC